MASHTNNPAMNKRVFLIVLSVSLLAILIFYTGIRRQEFRKEIKVPYTMFKVAQQFRDATNLSRWYIPFIGSDSSQFRSGKLVNGEYELQIIPQTLVSARLQAKGKGEQMNFYLSASPDTGSGKETYVQLSYQTTMLNSWFNKSTLIQNAERSLVQLKEYMEDTRQLYGYEIKMTEVADTLFLYRTETVPYSDRKETTRKLFDQLISFAEEHGAGYNGTRILYSQHSDGEINLYASIGISNLIPLPEGSLFQHKKMPFGKKLLEATYQGTFGESGKAFQALETFKTDHNMVSMAMPFAKILNEDFDFSDSTYVQLKIYYPVF